MGFNLTRNHLLGHPLRRALLDSIRDRPGVAFLDLFGRFKPDPTFGPSLGFGNLAYHLQKMERAGLVTSRRSGRCRRYYQNGGPQGSETTALAVLQAASEADLVDLLVAQPGASQRALWMLRSASVPCSRQSVGHQLQRMEAHGLVVSVRRDRGKAYYATELALRLRPLAAPMRAPAPTPQPAEPMPQVVAA